MDISQLFTNLQIFFYVNWNCDERHIFFVKIGSLGSRPSSAYSAPSFARLSAIPFPSWPVGPGWFLLVRTKIKVGTNLFFYYLHIQFGIWSEFHHGSSDHPQRRRWHSVQHPSKSSDALPKPQPGGGKSVPIIWIFRCRSGRIFTFAGFLDIWYPALWEPDIRYPANPPDIWFFLTKIQDFPFSYFCFVPLYFIRQKWQLNKK